MKKNWVYRQTYRLNFHMHKYTCRSAYAIINFQNKNTYLLAKKTAAELRLQVLPLGWLGGYWRQAGRSKWWGDTFRYLLPESQSVCLSVCFSMTVSVCLMCLLGRKNWRRSDRLPPAAPCGAIYWTGWSTGCLAGHCRQTFYFL